MTQKLIRNSNLMASAIDDELVMMDIEQGNYFGLNAVGAYIWTLLETPQSRDDIMGQVKDNFEAPDVSTLEKDVLDFIQTMIDNKLVQFGG
ncbi:PqqD family protein [Fretibacter rubidus]|uniref:PqqD family protein n=1 Tax=Fretibacter rubidus TaxID=570162 RepID=UPI00352A6068